MSRKYSGKFNKQPEFDPSKLVFGDNGKKFSGEFNSPDDNCEPGEGGGSPGEGPGNGGPGNGGISGGIESILQEGVILSKNSKFNELNINTPTSAHEIKLYNSIESIIEGFEDEVINPNYIMTGKAPWVLTTDSKKSGEKSIKITPGASESMENYSIEMPFNIAEEGQISVSLHCPNAHSDDRVDIYLNNKKVFNTINDKFTWKEFIFPEKVKAGENKIKINFYKYVSSSKGELFIDDIKITTLKERE